MFENDEIQEDQVIYTLEEKKPKKPRKSRAKPKILETINEEIEVENALRMEEISQEPIEDFTIPTIEDTINDDFLSELNNTNYTEPIVPLYIEPTRVLPRKRAPRKPQVKEEIEYEEPEIDIYSNDPTPIQGRDRLILQQKVKQYMLLFPAELKTFKIAKNQTVENLEAILLEMETIVEIGNVDSFVTDSIMQCIKMVEPMTASTKNYNITGLSLLLKNSPQFNSLLKQLYLKYNTYSQIPIEIQCGMIVITSTILMTQKNKNKSAMDAYLNEPVGMP